ncbi:MAG: AbrB/MazE/SpoVT family DNA-binding domain-containing protein [Alphaproteobacteria bacterium]|jgi:antitoxin PrlF|nr:AbrB/MazE/SpoVT family DNA-binding domain-containing protein [Alphaproteobacteria bacterium]MBU0833339.1 AbrB/MazE/SpoVT family DNA-binding domain-containing protein [Alphaproteobacteria bacterium]MBU1762970.1 AbrB/MazE/SpoVT family DNA-binding domain-containing protein [Alphaproteobacteria bacterium]
MKVWEATMSAKGQITIPKEMRELLKLNPGDQMVYSVVDGEIVITPKNIDMKDLAGFLGTPPNGRATLEEIDEAVIRTAGANALLTGGDDPSDIAA